MRDRKVVEQGGGPMLLGLPMPVPYIHIVRIEGEHSHFRDGS